MLMQLFLVANSRDEDRNVVEQEAREAWSRGKKAILFFFLSCGHITFKSCHDFATTWVETTSKDMLRRYYLVLPGRMRQVEEGEHTPNHGERNSASTIIRRLLHISTLTKRYTNNDLTQA